MESSNNALNFSHTRHCPKCNFEVTEYEWKTTSYDLPCPRCENATLSEFLTKAELLSIKTAELHPDWFGDK